MEGIREVLSVFGIENVVMEKKMSDQLAKVAKSLNVEEKEIPAELKRMLAEIKKEKGEHFAEYHSQLGKWLAANQDLLTVAGDIRGNFLKSKV